MKIVLTCHQFLPEYSSGTELITYNIAKELRARGHEVKIITGYPARDPLPDDKRFDQYEYDGFQVDRFHHAFTPMGGHKDIMASEYNNLFFKSFFKSYLDREKPDVVHFIHLGRLSASAIDACEEANIPCLFMSTDFWLACPTNQLRLPNNAMCSGPKYGGANCLRHIAQTSQPARIVNKLRFVPDWALGFGIWLFNKGLFKNRWYAPLIRSLSARQPFLRNRAAKLAKMIVPSRIMADMLVRNGYNRDDMVLLPYGIDTRHIPRITERGRTAADPLRIIFLGTLYEHKGPHVLIKAVKSLPPDVNVELRLHGKTEEFPAYTQQLRDIINNDTRITLCGPYKNTQVGEILTNADVLVCPSVWYENTPLVIYEAMAAGLPVLCSDLGGMAESIQPNVNGLLFRVGDSDDLAQQLLKLARDRDLVRKFAANTKMPLTWAEHVTQLEAIYIAQLPAIPTPNA